MDLSKRIATIKEDIVKMKSGQCSTGDSASGYLLEVDLGNLALNTLTRFEIWVEPTTNKENFFCLIKGSLIPITYKNGTTSGTPTQLYYKPDWFYQDINDPTHFGITLRDTPSQVQTEVSFLASSYYKAYVWSNAPCVLKKVSRTAG